MKYKLVALAVATAVLHVADASCAPAVTASQDGKLLRLTTLARINGPATHYEKFCRLFALVESGGSCLVAQLSHAEDDGTHLASIFDDPATKAAHIILAKHDSEAGYAYLTDQDARLEKVLFGARENGMFGSKSQAWRWNAIGITDGVLKRFNKEVSYWGMKSDDLAKSKPHKG
jgi:hypothetical protein